MLLVILSSLPTGLKLSPFLIFCMVNWDELLFVVVCAKDPSLNVRAINGHKCGMLATIIAVAISPAYQLKYTREPIGALKFVIRLRTAQRI